LIVSLRGLLKEQMAAGRQTDGCLSLMPDFRLRNGANIEESTLARAFAWFMAAVASL
jgi:hypothetical protein